MRGNLVVIELAHEHIDADGKLGGLDTADFLYESAWPLADRTIGTAFYRI